MTTCWATIRATVSGVCMFLAALAVLWVPEGRASARAPELAAA